jgi:hypothetical protein
MALLYWRNGGQQRLENAVFSKTNACVPQKATHFSGKKSHKWQSLGLDSPLIQNFDDLSQLRFEHLDTRHHEPDARGLDAQLRCRVPLQVHYIIANDQRASPPSLAAHETSGQIA